MSTRPTPSSTNGCCPWPPTGSKADAGRRLPGRVLLYGVTGSGTSTAALAIGDRTDRPVTLVDELTSITREPRCNGNVETWRAIARRDSIIVWHFRSFARKRARMRAWAASSDGPTVLLFRRPRDLAAWLATLTPSG